jgi:hypothetical protein
MRESESARERERRRERVCSLSLPAIQERERERGLERGGMEEGGVGRAWFEILFGGFNGMHSIRHLLEFQ